MKKNRTILAILGLFLMLTHSDTWAKKNKDSKPRPFKARFSTEFANADFNPASFIFTTVVNGSGNATHLGKCSFDAVHSFAFTTPTMTEGVAWNGTLEFGAANGDILSATYAGDIVPSGDPEIPFLLLFTVHFDGGTGRFSDASGSADVIGLTTIEPDPSNGLFMGTSEFTFEGTIQY